MPDDSTPEDTTPADSPDDDSTRPDSTPEPELHKLDPRSLRGLAHPLRMRMLTSLRHNGSATASQLAEEMGESSGSTSYHLRQLAAHGFVEDDPERGKGRERWWKAAHSGVMVDAALYQNPSPEVRGALDVLVHSVATMHGQEIGTFLGTRHDWSEEWSSKADLSDFTLRMTPGLLGELDGKIHALIDSYRDRALREADENTAQVRLHVHAFPLKKN
ncbi:helix-turn-helix domain-containing protein [Streptomyces sp. AcH 505]|uniref:helix-turn-helix domain-containing protein n=1 Tax=Streptomyces sp. AcH 505 TaxID=352211 RepID=UPI00099D0ED8